MKNRLNIQRKYSLYKWNKSFFCTLFITVETLAYLEISDPEKSFNCIHYLINRIYLVGWTNDQAVCQYLSVDNVCEAACLGKTENYFKTFSLTLFCFVHVTEGIKLLNMYYMWIPIFELRIHLYSLQIYHDIVLKDSVFLWLLFNNLRAFWLSG